MDLWVEFGGGGLDGYRGPDGCDREVLVTLALDVLCEAHGEDRHAELGHCVGGFAVDEARVDRWGYHDDPAGVVLGFDVREGGLDCAVET